MALENLLKVYNEDGVSQGYDILADDVKFSPDGKDLPTKLAEMQQGIDDAGQVNEIVMNGQHYTPTNKAIDLGTVITQHQDISGKVDKEQGKGLSTNDYTTAEKDKLDALPTSTELGTQLGEKADKSTTYTKTETDAAIADAVEGFGGGSVDSVTINGVNHEPINGVVDLGTIQGKPGAQGPAGNTYLVDENFDPVSMIINNLDESDGTVALSARQGKILKQNVEALWAKVNALISDLAAMAFTGNKTSELGTIDWTGGTFYATIVKSLTGCTATDNTTNGQIAEGSTLTMQLTASSGYTLTGATISVTDSRGQSVAYTLNGSTLSVANVMGTITISVVAVAVYSVVNNDTHVDMTTQTPNPVAGSSWSGTLSLKSGVTGYALASNPQVTMGSVAVDLTASGNSWNPSTGAMTIGNVTGDIVILEAAVEVVAHTITKKLLNYTASDDGTSTTDADFGYKKKSVEDGDDYSVTLSLANSATSNNDLLVKMGGVALDTDNTKTSYYTFDSSNGALVVKNVTADVTIIATACTGVVKVTSNAAVTAGLTISGTTISGTTITNKAIDLVNGELTLEDAMQTITKFSLSSGAKTAVTALDFGGAKITTLDDVFGAVSAANACTELISLRGLVANQFGSSKTMGYAFHGCSKLATLETIGWTATVDPNIHYAFKGTKLSALDIEDMNVVSENLTQIFNSTSNLVSVMLPDFPNIKNLTNAFGTSGIRRVSISGGSGITSLDSMFHDCVNLEYVDFSNVAITSSMTTITSFMNSAKSGITLKIGLFDLSGVSNSSAHKMDKVTTLICTTSTPQNSAMFTYLTALTAIYVPDAAEADYKSAWSGKAGIIHPISEYTE